MGLFGAVDGDFLGGCEGGGEEKDLTSEKCKDSKGSQFRRKMSGRRRKKTICFTAQAASLVQHHPYYACEL